MASRLRLFPVLATALMLSGCGSGGSQSLDIDVIGRPESPFETGQRLADAGPLVRSATADGLVGFDGGGRVIPAMADRWIVTNDGLSYIFRLRDGTWADGSELTGESAATALQRACNGLADTALGQDVSAIEDIRAMAGRVVEIRLSHPMPDLLEVLAQPELALLHKGRGTGPMRLKREGTLALLTPVAADRMGLPEGPDWKQRTRDINLHALNAVAAIKRFQDGTSSMVLGGALQDYPLALDAAGLSRRALRLDPVTGLFGLIVVRGDGVLATPELREALAMAIDRDALGRDLAIREWTPTSRIVSPSASEAPTALGERWQGFDMNRRRAEAASRIARWQARGGKSPVLRIAMPSGPGTDFLFTRLMTDLAAIGLSVTRVAQAAPADLRLLDSVSRYSGVNWYLNQLSCAAGRGLCSLKADQSANRARETADPAARAALLAEAEGALTQANVFLPLGTPIRWSLVSEPGYGFAINPRGYHPLPPMAVLPK